MQRESQSRAGLLSPLVVVVGGLFVLSLLFLVVPRSAVAAEVPIQNPGFEDPVLDPGRFVLVDEISGWTRSQGENLEIMNGVFGWTAAEGSQWIELDARENTGIYQDVATVSGHRYLLAFEYSPRPRVSAVSEGVEVFWDGKLVKHVARAGADSGTTWKQETLVLRATKRSTRLEFRGAGTSNSFGGFLDDVQLSDEGLAAASPGIERTVKAPAAGKAKTVTLPVNKKSKRGTVSVTGESFDEVVFTGLAVTEKARKLGKLKRTKKKLEVNCYVAVANQARADLAVGFDNEEEFYDLPLAFSMAILCGKLLGVLQQRIDEREQARDAQASLGSAQSCQVVRLQLRSQRKGGKWVTRVVTKGVKPRLKVTCKTTDDGFQLNLRATGKRKLRQVIGKKLVLGLRRSESAPAPKRGATLTVAFTQQ